MGRERESSKRNAYFANTRSERHVEHHLCICHGWWKVDHEYTSDEQAKGMAKLIEAAVLYDATGPACLGLGAFQVWSSDVSRIATPPRNSEGDAFEK